MNRQIYKVYSDGSFYVKEAHMGIGIYIKEFTEDGTFIKDHQIHYKYLAKNCIGKPTHNVAEMLGIFFGTLSVFELIRANKQYYGRIELNSDSKFCLSVIDKNLKSLGESYTHRGTQLLNYLEYKKDVLSIFSYLEGFDISLSYLSIKDENDNGIVYANYLSRKALNKEVQGRDKKRTRELSLI